LIGRVFDNRYEIIRRIGSGGMAEVYLAHDRHLDRDVALKVLLSRYAEDPIFIERFRREASSAAGLNHPHIVQIYDRGEAEGTYYIAMEYLEGRTLKDIIVRFAPLRVDHVLSISAQILEALRFAHRKDVIHRDIKPQNIMVDDEGRVKVTDFGIARAGSASSMTETGSILGTAHYLSPEQAQGVHLEAGSDLYSLGVLMYEMATGSLPFTGENPVAIAMQHVHEPPILPRERNPEVPEGLERVILKALTKDPQQRYQTAQDFLDDVGKVRDGRTVAPPPSFTDAPTTVMAGSLRPGPMDATQVRAGGAPRRGPVPSYESRYDESSPAGSATRSKGGRLPWVLLVLFVLVLAGGVWAVFSLLGGGDAVAAPNLVGKTFPEAEALAEEFGIKVAEGGPAEPSAQYPEGVIVRQEPAEGVKVGAGGTIKVWLSSGQETTEVPPLVGLTREQAGVALDQAGLVPDFREEASLDEPVGTVLRQDPTAGTKVDAGRTVIVYVSSGPPAGQVEVPNVIGKSQDDAVADLEEAKLVPRIQPRDSDRPEGEVVDQSPKGGVRVAEASFVTIWVSGGPQPTTVDVPRVIGMQRVAAISAIRVEGLVARVIEEPTGEHTAGEVFRQDPAGGTRVNRGSTVTIYVAVAPPTTTTTTAPTTTTTAAPTTTTTTITTTTTAP
jgi:serine/threonine-protein kinase